MGATPIATWHTYGTQGFAKVPWLLEHAATIDLKVALFSQGRAGLSEVRISCVFTMTYPQTIGRERVGGILFSIFKLVLCGPHVHVPSVCSRLAFPHDTRHMAQQAL